MQFCAMIQTSFDANLERLNVGVARALAHFDRGKFFRLLVFQFFAYLERSSLYASYDASNLMIVFPIILIKHYF